VQTTKYKENPAGLKKKTKKQTPNTSKWFALLSQNWPTGPNADGLQKLRLHSGSREAWLPVGRPSDISAVKTQGEPS